MHCQLLSETKRCIANYTEKLKDALPITQSNQKNIANCSEKLKDAFPITQSNQKMHCQLLRETERCIANYSE